MLMPTEIRDEVERVIRAGSHSNYMTAAQILARLPETLREQIIAERREASQESGGRYTAISVVSQAAMLLYDAEICERTYIDGRDLWFEIDGDLSQAGNAACACFRIRRNDGSLA